MLKQCTSIKMNAALLAALASVVLVLSSTPASAISLEVPITQVGAQSDYSQPMMQGIRYAQSGRQNRQGRYQHNAEQKRALRSRREVIQEVKQRHRGAEILKIALNRSGTSYNVRVLMPNGAVRSLQVSALR